MRWLLLVLCLAACGSRVEAREEPPAAGEDARDRWRRPDTLVALLGLAPGQRVADVGAGDGYLTGRLARAVGPDGHVVATEVDLFVLARLAARVAGTGVEVRLAERATPGLEALRYQRILLAQVDQYLADRVAYFAALGRALAIDGRLVISNRAIYRGAVITAAAAAGLRLVSAEDQAIPGQFVLTYVREVSP